ncbi:hypothetical protein ONS96_001039 [Cadophora gregata f. sp. sojae]|nr:hypothetical protein ONS96_001039 [Cadophora gregata f. sp. sojae]
MEAADANEADKAEVQDQSELQVRSTLLSPNESAWQLKDQGDQHDAFVNGRTNWRPVPLAGMDSGVVATLPAPLVAARSGGGGRTTTPPARIQELDLFSDADRENIESRDNNNTTFQFNFGGEDQNAEETDTTSPCDTFIFTSTSADSTVGPSNKPVHPP